MLKIKIYISLFILFFILFAVACSAEKNRDWTILVYLDGDNDLVDANIADMAEMQAGATEDHIRILIQFDRPNGIPAKRFEIKQGVITELENIGEVNMAQAKTLTDFLLWAKSMEHEKPDHLMLVLSDHGNGWDQGLGPSPPLTTIRSMFVDYDNATGAIPALANHLIARAIQDAKLDIDILGLDASVMGTIEAIYEFSDLATIIISSQEVGFPSGWDYEDIFKQLSANKNMEPKTFAETIVNSYKRYYEEILYPSDTNITDQRFSIAAHWGWGIKPVVTAINGFATELLEKLSKENSISEPNEAVTQIQDARRIVQEIDLYNQIKVYVDLSHLISLLNQESQVIGLLNNATIIEYHGRDRPSAKGMSIVFFQVPNAWEFNTCDSNYKNWSATSNTGNSGKFINETLWDEMLAKYYGKIVPTYPSIKREHPCNRLFQPGNASQK